MLTGKDVLIISPNQLIGLGLKAILLECFSPENVSIMASIDDGRVDGSVDYVFMQPETYVVNQDRFRELRGKIIVLAENEPTNEASLPPTLNITSSESEIIERMQRIFSLSLKHKSQEIQVHLTSREIDVLKLVARGEANKQIAHRLSISMHTVISHRKNITRKLGIKTVSGLTMYAVLNGLISSKDIR